MWQKVLNVDLMVCSPIYAQAILMCHLQNSYSLALAENIKTQHPNKFSHILGSVKISHEYYYWNKLDVSILLHNHK